MQYRDFLKMVKRRHLKDMKNYYQNAEGKIYQNDYVFCKLYHSRKKIEALEQKKQILEAYRNHGVLEGMVPFIDTIEKEEQLVGSMYTFLKDQTNLSKIEELNQFYTFALQASKQMEYYHQKEHFITDLNFSNILIGPQGKITFVDIDSWSLPGFKTYCISDLLNLHLMMYHQSGLYSSAGSSFDLMGFYSEFLGHIVPQYYLPSNYEKVEKRLEESSVSKEQQKVLCKFMRENPTNVELPYFHKLT